MGRNNTKNNNKTEKVSRTFGFLKGGRKGFGGVDLTNSVGQTITTVSTTVETRHHQKPPIRLTYRRGVLISSKNTESDLIKSFQNKNKSEDGEDAKVKEECEIKFQKNRKEDEERWSRRSSSSGESENDASHFQSNLKKQKLRNSNSLESCTVVSNLKEETTTATTKNFKIERKLSLPTDINELEKLEEEKMAALSNGHAKSQSPNLTNSQFQTKVTCQKDFITGFALVEACQSNNERKVKELVRKMCCMSSAEVGPLVNFQDQTGRTALSFACAFGNVSIIEELSKLRRLDPNLGDNDGNAPLHYAAQAGQSTAVDLLLLRFEGVIDPNCRNSTGLTPLHKAALQGRSRVAKSLIMAGASPYIRDYSRNMTPMEWARLCGRHICAEVIVRAARDNHSPSVGSPPADYNSNNHRTFPSSQSAMELKRLNSDDSPFYHLQNARNTISGANWLKNKIKKAIGVNSSSQPLSRSESSSFGRMSTHLGGATLCAGSLILPSIKPLIDQQQKSKVNQKMKIPTVQVTQVKR